MLHFVRVANDYGGRAGKCQGAGSSEPGDPNGHNPARASTL
jgi:hypothetical protein